jgi:hypothetical protein
VLHPIRSGTMLLGLEIKAPKGRPSLTQEAMAAQFRAVGGGYEFCRSLEDIEYALITSGIPLHASITPTGGIWGTAA